MRGERDRYHLVRITAGNHRYYSGFSSRWRWVTGVLARRENRTEKATGAHPGWTVSTKPPRGAL